MRVFLYAFFVAFAAFSCTGSSEESKNKGVDLNALHEEIAMLKSENLKKDSLVTESITFFNEIERNLSYIEVKEKEIRAHFNDTGRTKRSSKDVILQKIKYINELRLQNGQKMYALQQRLDTLDIAENQFKEILTRLQSDIKQKDKEIAQLQKTLEQKGKEYVALFADYQEQIKINQQQKEAENEIRNNLNTVYYVTGSQKELKSQGIIQVTKKGFSAKKVELNGNFNESQFNLIKMDETKEILVDAKSILLITDHPESSYQVVDEGHKVRLKILNPELFWKISRYLVIQTK